MSAVVAKVETLSNEERRRYRLCVRRVKAALWSIADVAGTLIEIRDDRLYRANYPTFEDFCRGEFGIERAHAYRLIDAGEVIENLQKCLHVETKSLPAPKTEIQLRALATLPADEQPAAWARAVEVAGGGQPTGPQVAAVVRELRPAAPAPARDAASYAAPLLAAVAALDLADPVQLHALRLVLDAAQDRLQCAGY